MGIIITIILLILLPFSVSAQTVSGKCTDALSLALARGTDHLTTSSLSSQKGFLPKFSYSEIAVGSQYETGSLHRPQTGEDILDINFDALGGRRLGKFFLDGGFSFRQRFENNVKFASTFDPLRGNPYYIADSTGGDWRKQSYNLWADVAFNVLDDRLTAGLGLDVEVGRGAKKIGICYRLPIRTALQWSRRCLIMPIVLEYSHYQWFTLCLRSLPTLSCMIPPSLRNSIL